MAPSTHPFRFPTPLHDSLLAGLLQTLTSGERVIGVMVIGSLARGTAREDSDIDLVVVQSAGERWAYRKQHGPIQVEIGVRTVEEWRATFSPSRVGDESWGYAFLDGAILHDPAGELQALVKAAVAIHAGYRVPDSIKRHFAWLWSHVLPKMRLVLRNGDATEIGWASAVMMDSVLQSVWAINDRPLPSRDLGTLRRHLDELTVPAGAPGTIRQMLQAAPETSLRLQVDLIEDVIQYLPSEATGMYENDGGEELRKELRQREGGANPSRGNSSLQPDTMRPAPD